MMKFKSFITEKRDSLMFQRMPDAPPKLINGLRNPSASEIQGALKKASFGELRFIIGKDGTMLVWDADAALHAQVAAGEFGAKLTRGGMDTQGSDYEGGLIYKEDAIDEIIIGFHTELFRGATKKYAKKSRALLNLEKNDKIRVMT